MTHVAVTGGTGFVGRHVVERLRAAGDEVVILSRRTGFDLAAAELSTATAALQGCDALVHCAGINREIGSQTYDAVHVRGTRRLIEAARAANVGHVSILSFLRARPDGPTSYHRSKWAAEEIVRSSGIPFTVLKAGVIHGRGDHMLDHLSHALLTFPVFGLVGLHERAVRPVAVGDVARILVAAANGDARLRDATLAVLGPEAMPLRDAVRRVATAVDRHPRCIRLPVAAHVGLAHVWEATMRVPLISLAQVHILAEGVTEVAPFGTEPPPDLRPSTPFDVPTIRAGLPAAERYGCRDLRWCRP
ncbi:MAG: SDR family oxidoreductase [Candidatus Limnocylindria bacterium]